jgi:hypothetical protein
MARLPNFGEIIIDGDVQVIDSFGNGHLISPRDRVTDIENEINQMHLLLNKLCPGTYGAIGGTTVAERFEEFLKTGPDWISVKKEENK